MAASYFRLKSRRRTILTGNENEEAHDDTIDVTAITMPKDKEVFRNDKSRFSVRELNEWRKILSNDSREAFKGKNFLNFMLSKLDMID